MREIKFRGYDPAKDRWVYGATLSPIDTAIIHTLDGEYVTILPETLGQFTGLRDCYGNEIYEGDWVIDGKYSGFVKWEPRKCCFLNTHGGVPISPQCEVVGDNLGTIINIKNFE